MIEERRGGTHARKASRRTGCTFPENLDTTRFDGGAVWRRRRLAGRVLTVRGSATSQDHTHVFGAVTEDDDHRTLFGEASLMRHERTAYMGGRRRGAGRPLSLATGAAVRLHLCRAGRVRAGRLRGDAASSRSPAASASTRTTSSARFVSPRVSALIRPAGAWTMRVSTGRGYFAPTPFTEETEATGLTRRRAARRACGPSAADNVSADVTWTRGPLEVTATVVLFAHSRRLDARESGRRGLSDRDRQSRRPDGDARHRVHRALPSRAQHGRHRDAHVSVVDRAARLRAGARCRSIRGIRRRSTC